ncbi:MAG TPA: nitroreductase family deazaflavin-dependent oxidoreductase [Candidatus Limnocylindrales bacterium]|nr:nitroreductase family deazaflavin-dependent oxidoreductase [Candidatus Limnocylindrales bacterium]
MTQAPALIRRSGSITGRLLGAGIPMGPNALLTVRGRVSGLPRTAPIAIVELDGRRWVVGTYGDVQWTRNLRAAGEAEVRFGRQVEHVTARELLRAEAAGFFRDVVPAYLDRQPFVWRLLTRILLRLSAPEALRDPDQAATSRPVFELVAATDRSSGGSEDRPGI